MEPSTDRNVRIQKILAQAGYGSRRKCEQLIIDGKVTVNNRIAKLGESADPGKDVVMVSGVPVETEKKVYIALYKPTGYATTTMDKFAGRNVMQLVRINERIFPVGRLDKDAEGLLLLTNDGEFGNRIMHPRFEVEKIYISKLDKKVEEQDLERLRRGVILDDGKTWPAKARYFEGNKRVVELIIHEGRHKIVKRMFNALGYYIQRLTRTQIDGIMLKGLKPGMWRELGREEVEKIMRLPQHRRSSRPPRQERRPFSQEFPGERLHGRENPVPARGFPRGERLPFRRAERTRGFREDRMRPRVEQQRTFAKGFSPAERPAFTREKRSPGFRENRERPRAFHESRGAQRIEERAFPRNFSRQETQRRFRDDRAPARREQPYQREERPRRFEKDASAQHDRQPLFKRHQKRKGFRENDRKRPGNHS